MKRTRLLSTAALALGLVWGLVVVPAAPASAAAGGSWPVVPFQIQDRTGNCLSTAWDYRNQAVGGRITNQVWSKPCDALDLYQQFLYDPLTRQLSSAARVGWCLQAPPSLLNYLTYQLCDASTFLQRWDNMGPDAGQYFIRIAGYTFRGVGQIYWTRSDSTTRLFTVLRKLGQLGPNERFRFLPLATTP